jgi:hypothetical protein
MKNAVFDYLKVSSRHSSEGIENAIKVSVKVVDVSSKMRTK